MTIVHLSDTHGLHHEITDLPDGDILVHSGDFTMGGTEEEVVERTSPLRGCWISTAGGITVLSPCSHVSKK